MILERKSVRERNFSAKQVVGAKKEKKKMSWVPYLVRFLMCAPIVDVAWRYLGIACCCIMWFKCTNHWYLLAFNLEIVCYFRQLFGNRKCLKMFSCLKSVSGLEWRNFPGKRTLFPSAYPPKLWVVERTFLGCGSILGPAKLIKTTRNFLALISLFSTHKSNSNKSS